MFFGLNDVAFLAAVSAPALDPDAAAYIAAVEAADTQALEPAVRAAINDFVVGCKADGIWGAIKASCIMAGARTRLGAMVPLVGAAPTSFDFVDGDYNRKTGLVGDGSTKYLNSNRAGNADPQNSKHLAVYATSVASVGIFQDYISEYDALLGSVIVRSGSNPSNLFAAANGAIGASVAQGAATGLIGVSRANSSNQNFRVAQANNTQVIASAAPLNRSTLVFARPLPSLNGFSLARLAFYSIGESLDLALLDARVTALINAFDAAIP